MAYHVLMPLDDGRARVQAALGASGGLGPDLVPGRPIPLPDIDPQEIVEEAREGTERELANAVAGPPGHRRHGHRRAGRTATRSTRWPPRSRRSTAARRSSSPRSTSSPSCSAVDWTSKARRHLDVPVLHLMEQENFDEQAGGGEGASLI